MVRGERDRQRTVGFDFGTSTTLIASRRVGEIANTHPLGRLTEWLPSVVGLGEGGLVVGEDAEALPRQRAARSIKSALTRGESTVRLPDGQEVDVRAGVTALLQE